MGDTTASNQGANMTRGSGARQCPAAILFLPCPVNLTTATATLATHQVKVQAHEKVRNHLSQSESGAGAYSACTSAAQIRATYPKVPFICNYTNFANYLFKLVEEYDTGNGGSEHTGYGKHTEPNTNKSETHRTQISLSRELPFFLLIPAAAAPAFCSRAVDKWKRKWKFHGDSFRLMVLLISTNLFDSHTKTYPFRGRKRQELDFFVKRVKTFQ